MNDKILDSLNEKYGLVLTDSGETNEKAQKMTEINKLRFQNITYKAAKSTFESWKMQHGLKSQIKRKVKDYDDEFSESKREKISGDIAILMSKYIFLITDKKESPETIATRAIRLDDGMLDRAHGRANSILRELDKEATQAKINDRNIGTISDEDREELEKEIERARKNADTEDSVEDIKEDEGVLGKEEIVYEAEEGEEPEIVESEKEEDDKGLTAAEEVDIDIKEAEEESMTTGEAAENPIEEESEEIDKEEVSETGLIPVAQEKEETDDKGIIAKGMTDEEIEESRRLLEETAPKAKTSESSFMEPPRNRKDGETASQYEAYLDDYYKNLREKFYKSMPGNSEEAVAETSTDTDKDDKEDIVEDGKERDYVNEIKRLKEMSASLKEQVNATKKARNEANKSVEEAKKAAEERRKIEQEEVKKAEAERAQAEEQRIKKQKAMETVIEQFKVYLEGMKKEIKENEKGIESAKAEELEIIDASEKESAKNEEKKAAAYRERDEANEMITSQEAYIQEMLSSMDKADTEGSKKNSK